MAQAVGTPLVIDKATENRTRPSCARVKVEVDLMKELPKRIHISCVDEDTGEQGTEKQIPAKGKGKGAHYNGKHNNGNQPKMEWNVATNKKKRNYNMGENQKVNDKMETAGSSQQNLKGTMQGVNTNNNFAALTNVEEEQSVELVQEQKSKETAKPWIEASFGKQLQSSGEAHKENDSLNGNKDNKVHIEEESSSSKPESDKENKVDQSNNKVHGNNQSTTEAEQEVAKPEFGEEEMEHVVHDVDLNKEPDKPPDDSTEVAFEEEHPDPANKDTIGDNQSPSKGEKEAEIEVHNTGIHQKQNIIEVSDENMQNIEDNKREWKIQNRRHTEGAQQVGYQKF
ncbi:uncharacterized protein LOC132041382 [Lycium ferocissimum]|uniref:uncharacterized protein LOC132041382 n=1 Tax=Lycium ferocissimum TaxID=112874 RepID=UPI0028158187|nr:uncharacterized protein LOC132041382 [Lycium ferocissimum]